MKSEKFSIVINTYPNSTRDFDLSRCVDSILKQTYKNYKVFIIENYKDDSKIKPLVQKYKKEIELNVLLDPTKRLSFLFNLGWKSTDTELIAFIADDAEADPQWLEAIYNELKNDENVGVVSGPVVSTCFPAGNMHALYLSSRKNSFLKVLAWPYLHFAMEDKVLLPGNFFESGAYSIGAGLKESKKYKRQEIDLATTTSMGIRRSVLEKVGGFDERFNFNHADGDLFIRIKNAGYKIIFNPKVSSLHHVRLGPSRNAYFIGKDTGIFFKKHLFNKKSINGYLGFILNILMLNFYWVYAAIKNKDLSQLKGTSGFWQGIIL